MTLPFVARGTLVAIEASLAEMRETNRILQARFDALLDKYHSLRVTGQVPVSQPQPIEPAEPSAIDEAIAAKAGRNPGLRRHLTNLAKTEMRKPGMSEDVMVDRIMNWVDGSVDD